MAVVDQKAGVIRRAGVVSIGFGETFAIDGAILANSAGFIKVVGLGSGAGAVYGMAGSWSKGGAALETDTPTGYNPLTEYITAQANAVTTSVVAATPNVLEVGFVGGQLKITNNFGAVEIIVVTYDVTILTY